MRFFQLDEQGHSGSVLVEERKGSIGGQAARFVPFHGAGHSAPRSRDGLFCGTDLRLQRAMFVVVHVAESLSGSFGDSNEANRLSAMGVPSLAVVRRCNLRSFCTGVVFSESRLRKVTCSAHLPNLSLTCHTLTYLTSLMRHLA